MVHRLRAAPGSEAAQGTIEYALIVAMVSIVTLGVLAAAANGWITTITSEITGALS